MSHSILVINGPNLNLLGKREPGIYGSETLEAIEAACREVGRLRDLDVDFGQSNHEGEIVEWIQRAGDRHAGLILNAGAYTHTSVAILDALRACPLPIVEVHLSNIHQREEFRRHSFVSAAAWGVICGFGGLGYRLAVLALADRLAAAHRE